MDKTPQHTPGPGWYHHTKDDAIQGLVIDERTGATIAVVFDPKHTALIAAAPVMKAEMNWAASSLESVAANIRGELERKREPFGGSTWVILNMVEQDAARLRATIAKAEGR